MEKLPQFGTVIPQIIGPTFQTYMPLLSKQAGAIKSTKCETFDYGSHPRQKLDLYTPSAGTKPVTGNANSILLFLYGGGFVNGDKSLEFAGGLVYANLGHYFAEHLGFEVAVVDYRLVGHGAKYPSGGEDVSTAIDWVRRRSAGRSSEPLDIYLMGNSAGGVNIATYLLHPDFAASRSQIIPGSPSTGKLRAVILLAPPLHLHQADPSRKEVLDAYFGPDIHNMLPYGLLKAAKRNNTIDELSHIDQLVLQGSLDPEDEILTPIADFVKEWKDTPSVASKLTLQTLEGHNHVSPVLGVGTGVPAEEAWARDVVEFIVASSKK